MLLYVIEKQYLNTIMQHNMKEYGYIDTELVFIE
jgi:hypothetical protein